MDMFADFQTGASNYIRQATFPSAKVSGTWDNQHIREERIQIKDGMMKVDVTIPGRKGIKISVTQENEKYLLVL